MQDPPRSNSGPHPVTASRKSSRPAPLPRPDPEPGSCPPGYGGPSRDRRAAREDGGSGCRDWTLRDQCPRRSSSWRLAREYLRLTQRSRAWPAGVQDLRSHRPDTHACRAADRRARRVMLVSAADSSGDCRARARSAQWCRSGGVRPTPGDTGSTCPDFVLIRCLDDGQGLLAVTGWAAEDDEAIAGDRPGNQRQKCHTRLWSTGSTSRSGDS